MTDRIAICMGVEEAIRDLFPTMTGRNIQLNCDTRFDPIPSVRMVLPKGHLWHVVDIDFMVERIEVDLDTEHGPQRFFHYSDPQCIDKLLEYIGDVACQMKPLLNSLLLRA